MNAPTAHTLPDVGQIEHRKLPPQLRVLVRVLGETLAFRLVRERGGTYLVVPKRFEPSHWLHQLLGPEAFAALIEERGGLPPMQLPKYDSVLRQLRHQRVHELLDPAKGLSLQEVALATDYTLRQVINIKNAMPRVAPPLADQAQCDLFGHAEPAAPETQPPLPLPTAHQPFPASSCPADTAPGFSNGL